MHKLHAAVRSGTGCPLQVWLNLSAARSSNEASAPLWVEFDPVKRWKLGFVARGGEQLCLELRSVLVLCTPPSKVCGAYVT